jgi:hypothetical protein
MNETGKNDLDAIKRLMVLLLLKLGSTSEEIGSALGLDPSAVRRMVPSGKVKKLPISTTG